MPSVLGPKPETGQLRSPHFPKSLETSSIYVKTPKSSSPTHIPGVLHPSFRPEMGAAAVCGPSLFRVCGMKVPPEHPCQLPTGTAAGMDYSLGTAAVGGRVAPVPSNHSGTGWVWISGKHLKGVKLLRVQSSYCKLSPLRVLSTSGEGGLPCHREERAQSGKEHAKVTKVTQPIYF